MEHLSEHQIDEFKKAFSHFDVNGDGVISMSELSMAMKELGHNPTDIELQEMINEVDSNHDNVLDFNEFVTMMIKTIYDKETEQKTIEAFKLFDRDGSGVIRKTGLKNLMMNLGETMKEEEVDELLKLADEEDGLIDYSEFVKSIFSNNLTMA